MTKRLAPANSVRTALLIVAVALAWPVTGAAQVVPDSTLTQAERVDTLTSGVSPRGAMVRSLALWGWGQAAVGSYVRGGVWFSMEASTIYMLFRTIGRLHTAEELVDRVVAAATDSLNALIAVDTVAAQELEDPDAFAAAVDEAPGVAAARKLVSARTQQRQDWVTYAIFFTIMSGVDAYVNAHLHDFPTTISSDYRPDGSVTLGLRVPLPVWLGGSGSARRSPTGAAPASPPHRW